MSPDGTQVLSPARTSPGEHRECRDGKIAYTFKIGEAGRHRRAPDGKQLWVTSETTEPCS